MCLAAPAFAQNARYGMDAHDVSAPAADKLTELGAGLVRVVFGWDQIEPGCKGCFNWTATDGWRDQARRTHQMIFATVAFTPGWANGGRGISEPPLNMQDWYDFVHAAVDRYKSDIFYWGIWNEPNLSSYLRNGDLKIYTLLTTTAYAAIRDANPNARILGPEVSHHAFTNGWFSAAMRTLGGFFDIITVHWYPDGPTIEATMDRAVRPLLGGKPVWLTESGLAICQSTFGEAGQALLYDRVLQAFDARRAWWTAVMFYVLNDAATSPACGSGITRSDWSNRPAFSLYQAFIRAHP
jgi:hypothetical protein